MLYVYRLLAYCSSTQKNRRESFSPWPSSLPSSSPSSSSSSSSSTFSFFLSYILVALDSLDNGTFILYALAVHHSIKATSRKFVHFFCVWAFTFTILWDLYRARAWLDSEPMWMCVCCNVAPFFWFYNCVIQSNITKRLIAQFIFLLLPLLLLLLSFVRWHENVSVAIFYVLFFFFLHSFACFVLVCVVWCAKANDGDDDAYRSSRSECTRM